jgi:hypothetical protein
MTEEGRMSDRESRHLVPLPGAGRALAIPRGRYLVPVSLPRSPRQTPIPRLHDRPKPPPRMAYRMSEPPGADSDIQYPPPPASNAVATRGDIWDWRKRISPNEMLWIRTGVVAVVLSAFFSFLVLLT